MTIYHKVASAESERRYRGIFVILPTFYRNSLLLISWFGSFEWLHRKKESSLY